jgi:hypothetical protein
MPATGFFKRWSRLKAGEGDPAAPPVGSAVAFDAVVELPPLAQTTPHPAVVPVPGEDGGRALPTIEDVERLDAGADFSAFVTNGVDKAVQRLAMKKLFSDPHFRIMDGLDVYIDDYNKPDPLSAAMLASLKHARSLFPPKDDDESAKGDGGGAPDPAGPGAGPPPPQPPQDNA